MTKRDYLTLSENEKMPKIKVGVYPRYANIWVVVVNDRVFCRQFSTSKKGWYTAVLENSKASIKFKDSEFNILGEVPADNLSLTTAINKAYLKKYGGNFHPLSIVAWLMTTRKRSNRTLELVYNH